MSATKDYNQTAHFSLEPDEDIGDAQNKQYNCQKQEGVD
jgi:hypothetical protein